MAREEYGLAGAVQHGASTLPSNAFGNFRERMNTFRRVCKRADCGQEIDR